MIILHMIWFFFCKDLNHKRNNRIKVIYWFLLCIIGKKVFQVVNTKQQQKHFFYGDSYHLEKIIQNLLLHVMKYDQKKNIALALNSRWNVQLQKPRLNRINVIILAVNTLPLTILSSSLPNLYLYLVPSYTDRDKV